MVRLAQCLELHVDNAPREGLRLLDALAQHATHHIADFSPGQLAQLLCAHSAVRHCDEALLGAATQRVLEALQDGSLPDAHFSTGQLVDILFASVSLGRKPDGELHFSCNDLAEAIIPAMCAFPQKIKQFIIGSRISIFTYFFMRATNQFRALQGIELPLADPMIDGGCNLMPRFPIGT